MRLRAALGYLSAVVWVLAATGLVLLLQRLPHANLSLVYLLAVLIVATREGFWPSVLASVLSFLTYNFFFTPPFHTFQVDDEGAVATLVFFLAVAAIAGSLAAKMRDEMTKTKAAVERTSTLLAFSRRMAASADMPAALTGLTETIAGMLRCTAIAWSPDEGVKLEVCARAGTGGELPSGEALDLAWRMQDDFRRSRNWLLVPIGISNRRFALLGIDRESVRTQERELVIGLCEQTAAVLERIRLASDLDEARVAGEAERFRTALLSSVSHDLRTPLATIIGSVTSLRELWPSLGPQARIELLQGVVDESNRLDRYIQNLLDMTRLGHGAPLLRREWVDLNDIVANAIRRLDTVLDNVRLTIDIQPGAALMHVHGAFIEQVVVNLLDNAAKFSPPLGQVTLTAGRQSSDFGGDYVIEVVDEGPGIPETERESIFEMFYSARGAQQSQLGSGLGLAICRGLVGAHGGDIRAVAPTGDSGTCIRVRLPSTVDENEPPAQGARSA